MTTEHSALELYNQTLDLLGQVGNLTASNISNEDHPAARWFVRNADPVRRQLLRSYPWTFAKELTSITKDGTDPTFDYLYRYAIPSDWLRVLPITKDGYTTGDLIHYKIVGNFIHTNAESPLRVMGIQDMTDPTAWEDLFAEAYIGALARKYALRLTGKINYQQIANEHFRQAIETAISVGAVEEYMDPIEAHDIIRVRE